MSPTGNLNRSQVWRRTSTILLGVLALVAIGMPGAQAAAPSNDDFEDATAVVGLGYTDSVSTGDATTEEDEPQECGNVGKTVWYSFTPAGTGPALRLLADTHGSEYDTVLTVFTGTGLDDLEPVECNDDKWGGRTSEVWFEATRGVTYYFQVGGYDGAGGGATFHLRVEPGGTISGTVVDTLAQPLEGVCVDLNEGDFFTNTDADGTYSFTVPPGDYVVSFGGFCAGNYVSEWYDDTDHENAHSVEVTSGSASYADAVLAFGGSVSGWVTDEETGEPIEDVCVEAWQDVDGEKADELDYTLTDEEGYYDLDGLPPIAFRLEFYGPCAGNYAPQWHPSDADDWEGATSFLLEANESLDIDAELRRGGSISGTIYDDDGEAIDDACVDVFESEAGSDPWDEPVGSGVADDDGDYEVDGLPTGEYKVQFFEDCDWPYEELGWYDGENDFDDADVVEVEIGEETRNVDWGEEEVYSDTGGRGYLNVSPEAAENVLPADASHTLTAYFDEDDLYAGEEDEIDFEIVSGPNDDSGSGADLDCSLSGDECAIAYSSNGVAGTDVICAWNDKDDDDTFDEDGSEWDGGRCDLESLSSSGSSDYDYTDVVEKEWVRVTPTPTPTPTPSSVPQCNDGIDNDNDRKVDYPNDSACSSLLDGDESPADQVLGRILVPTYLGIGYDRDIGGFDGRVRSSRPGCRRGRMVTLKHIDIGPNTVVGAITTDFAGWWQIPKSSPDGPYYATVRSKTFTTGDGTQVVCRSDRSRILSL